MPRRALRDRVICITGASAGIGEATALACADAGMDVALAARRLDRLEDVAERIRAKGRRALAIRCDVASDDDVQAMIDETASWFGRLDAVLANAGYGLEQGAAAYDDEAWRRIFEVNFWGSLRCVRAAAPIFRARRDGHLLLTSSCVSRFTLPYYSAYCATKAAQTQVARALRLELEPEGIDVSVVHPVTTRTEFFNTSAAMSEMPDEGIPDHTPKPFVQPASRVADAIVRCLERPVPEVWTSHITRIGCGLMVAFPRLAEPIFRREAERRRRRLRERDGTTTGPAAAEGTPPTQPADEG